MGRRAGIHASRFGLAVGMRPRMPGSYCWAAELRVLEHYQSLAWRFEDLSIVPQPATVVVRFNAAGRGLPQTPRQDAGRYLDGIVVPALAEPQIHFGTAWDVPTYRN